MEKKARILVIEDADSIRNMIVYALNQADFMVDEASDGLKALELAKKHKYDLLLIDWMLPNLSGFEIVENLRVNNHQEIMMMLTAKDSDEDIIRAFEIGVDDYLCKPISPKVLITRIKVHLKRIKSKESVFKVDNFVVDFEKREVVIDNKKINLTCKEFDLLEYLISHKNTVVSRDNILNELWDFSYDGDTRIVDVHILKLRNKIKAPTIKIETNRGVGYMLMVYES